MFKFMFKFGLLAMFTLAWGSCADWVSPPAPAQENPSEWPEGYHFPLSLPFWVVEDDPKTTIFDRTDLERDRQVGKIMVIPFYRYYQNDDGTVDRLAIAHPFVCHPGEEYEVTLATMGQRKNLDQLIIWVPGYFPGSIYKIFTWVPLIKGQRMIALELQPCIGDEARQINTAMAEMLQGDIIIGNKVYLRRPTPPSADLKTRMSDEHYDAARVVRSTEYEGRYFVDKYNENNHVLWAFEAGARVVNRLSPEDKKMVAEFAASAMQDRPTSASVHR